MEATFAIANRYGDALRGGWRHVLDCIVRLYKAALLPPACIAADGEDVDAAEARMPRPLVTKSKGSSGSLFSRAINSLISIETADGAGSEAAVAREQDALANAAATAAACRVEDLIADSKFLVSAVSGCHQSSFLIALLEYR
jgi:brefeldin A-resistance guanine nucleotide exchange factor 1